MYAYAVCEMYVLIALHNSRSWRIGRYFSNSRWRQYQAGNIEKDDECFQSSWMTGRIDHGYRWRIWRGTRRKRMNGMLHISCVQTTCANNYGQDGWRRGEDGGREVIQCMDCNEKSLSMSNAHIWLDLQDGRGRYLPIGRVPPMINQQFLIFAFNLTVPSRNVSWWLLHEWAEYSPLRIGMRRELCSTAKHAWGKVEGKKRTSCEETHVEHTMGIKNHIETGKWRNSHNIPH